MKQSMPTSKKIQLSFALTLLAILLASCSNNENPTAISNTRSAAKEMTRDFQEWLDAQGTFCTPDGAGGCYLFHPPSPNYMGWVDPETGYSIWPDFTGVAADAIFQETGGAVDLGTTVTGTVTEDTRDDGRTVVNVVLKAENVLVFGYSIFTGEMLFGSLPGDVVAGAKPALGSVRMNFKYVMPGPGLPFRDYFEVCFFPTEDMYSLFTSFNCRAEGTLHEATGYPEGFWGRARAHQVQTEQPQPQNNTNWDAWPVEKIYFGK